MPPLPLAAFDPFATPDRRWLLAGRLAPDRRRLRREHRADAPLMAAIVHLRGRPDADIAAALRLHETDDVLRWAAEAWLLAGLDDAQIARRTGQAPAVVAAYEGLWWDVRRRLGCTDWLLLRCVGSAAWRGFRSDEVRQFWAYAALAGGPLLVDRLVAPVLRTGTTQPMLDVYLDDGRLDPRLRRWIAAKVEPVAGIEPSAEFESLRCLRGIAKVEPLVVAAVESGIAGLRSLALPESRSIVAPDLGEHLERLAAGLRAVRSVQPATSASAGLQASATGRTRASTATAPRRRLAAVG